MSKTEKQEYIDDMFRRRGYVLDYHKVLTEHDFEVMRKADELVEATYLRERRLDKQAKELIFIAVLSAMRATKHHIAGHIRAALALGLSKEEILEAIELVLAPAGVVAFQEGFDAWREVVEARGIEPSIGRTTNAGG